MLGVELVGDELGYRTFFSGWKRTIRTFGRKRQARVALPLMLTHMHKIVA